MRFSCFCLLLFFFACAPTSDKPPAPVPVASEDSVVAPTPAPSPVPFAKAIDYDTTLWQELASGDSTLLIDLKYATTDNFVAEKMYPCGRCFLRPEVARAVLDIHQQLQSQNLGLKLLDCYRPRPIQQKLWDKVPNPSYVTPPKKGSMHNRGRAVDLTLTDGMGRELDMGTPFDFFGPKAHHTCTDLPDSILQRRRLLKNIMENNGFRAIRTEWWHYSYAKQGYALADWVWSCGE